MWLNEAVLLYVGSEPGAEGRSKINLHSSWWVSGLLTVAMLVRVTPASALVRRLAETDAHLSPRRKWTTIWLLYLLAAKVTLTPSPGSPLTRRSAQ